MSRERRIALAVCVAGCVLLGKLPTALAIPAFLKEFQAKYVKPDSTDEKEKAFAELVNTKTKCNVCHVGTSKKMRNAYRHAAGEDSEERQFQARPAEERSRRRAKRKSSRRSMPWRR